MSRRTVLRPDAVKEDKLEDADGNTFIAVEEHENEDKIRFGTGGSERMVIDNAGNVGIGTHEPSDLLTLDSSQPCIQFKEDGQNRSKIFINDSDNLIIQQQQTNKHIVLKINDAGTVREGIRLNGTVPEIVVNEQSDSLVDFRVESNNNTHMLFVDGENDRVGIGNSSPGDALDVTGNVRVSNYIRLNCQNTVTPPGSPPLLNHAHIYSKLTDGVAEIFVQDSSRNETRISSHNPEGEWQYFSRNTRTGKVVRVNMEKMIRRLEEITGESFMEEWYEDPTD